MSSQMPIAIRATAYWMTRRWLKSRYLSIRYDARFADGREKRGADLDAALQGSNFPADYSGQPVTNLLASLCRQQQANYPTSSFSAAGHRREGVGGRNEARVC